MPLPSWEEFHSNHPDLPEEQLRSIYEQGQMLEQARQRVVEAQGSSEHPALYAARRSVPLFSTLWGAAEDIQRRRSSERIASGNASQEDYNIWAHGQIRQQQEQARGIVGQTASALAHVPAIAGEFALGGAALGRAAQIPRLGFLAGSAEGAGLTARAAGYVGRTAAQTATMPSMYLQPWIRHNEEEGREPLDIRGLPAPFASAMIQTAILGSIGGQVHRVVPGTGVASTLTRLGLAGPVGAIESATGDVLAYAGGLQTHYGPLQDLLEGKHDEFWKHTIASMATFAVFAGMHEFTNRRRPAPGQEPQTTEAGEPYGPPRPEQLPEASREVVDEFVNRLNTLADQGVPGPEAARQAAESLPLPHHANTPEAQQWRQLADMQMRELRSPGQERQLTTLREQAVRGLRSAGHSADVAENMLATYERHVTQPQEAARIENEPVRRYLQARMSGEQPGAIASANLEPMREEALASLRRMGYTAEGAEKEIATYEAHIADPNFTPPPVKPAKDRFGREVIPPSGVYGNVPQPVSTHAQMWAFLGGLKNDAMRRYLIARLNAGVAKGESVGKPANKYGQQELLPSQRAAVDPLAWKAVQEGMPAEQATGIANREHPLNAAVARRMEEIRGAQQEPGAEAQPTAQPEQGAAPVAEAAPTPPAAPPPAPPKGDFPHFAQTPELQARLERVAPAELEAWREAKASRDAAPTLSMKAKLRKPLEAAYNALKAAMERPEPAPQAEPIQPQAPQQTVQGFKTAKGSTYEVHEDGTTTRTKAARADVGHEGDFGKKERTEKTIYVDKDKVAHLTSAGLQGDAEAKYRVVLRDGKAWLISWNKKENRWGATPEAREIPYSEQPSVGMAPLELWQKTDELKGYEAYRGMHAGNEIVEVTPNRAEPLPPEEYRPAGGTFGEGPLIRTGSEKRTALAHEVARGGQAEERVQEGTAPTHEAALAEIERMAQESQSDKAVWEAARRTAAEQPGRASELAHEIVDKLGKRGTTAEEQALLLHRQISVRNELKQAEMEASGGRAADLSDRAFKKLAEKIESLRTERDLVDRAADLSGSEAGRAFRFRRMFVKFDYSLDSLLAQARAAKRGKPLTDLEIKEITDLQKEIERLQGELDKANAAKKAKGEPTSGPSEEDFQLSKPKKKVKQVIQKIKDEAQPAHIRHIRNVLDVLNIPRSLMASIDFPLFRQGWIAALSHPIRTAKSIPEMLKSFASEDAAQRAQYMLENRPSFELATESGLEITHREGPLSEHEEGFMSRFVHSIPGVGHIVRASERSYHTVLNRIRMDNFEALTQTLAGKGQLTMGDAKVLANYVNVMTGRGNLYGAQKAATFLSQIFFAPRWALSRWQYLIGQPLAHGILKEGLTPHARKLIAMEYARFGVGTGLVAALAAGMGFALNDDMRSTDFGRAVIGNTRLDISGALQAPLVLTNRLIRGERTTLSGDVRPTVGERFYGDMTNRDAMSNYLWQRLAPAPAAASNLVNREDVMHRPISIAGQAESLVTPLFIRDVSEAYRDLGVPRATALTLLALGGMGMQTYQPGGTQQEELGPISQLLGRTPAQHPGYLRGRRR